MAQFSTCYVRQSLNSNVYLFPVKHCIPGRVRPMQPEYDSRVIVVRMLKAQNDVLTPGL